MHSFTLPSLAREVAHAEPGRLYHEFLRVPSMSAGLYVLPAGGVDPQKPHKDHEMYYVVSGRAVIRVAEEDRPLEAGSVVFVAAGVEHRFHSIAVELSVLVIFAPAASQR